MDWSLVLVSQGIEPELHASIDGSPAELRVSVPEFERARQILAQYERENRHRRWRQQVTRTGLVYDWQSVGWGILLGVLYLLSVLDHSPLRSAGEFNSASVREGEWWRAFTAIWLHVDLRHLASNLTTGLVFLGVAMAEYGAGPALVGMTLAGAAANGIGLWFRPGHYYGLGASGAVMAALGIIAVRSFRVREWQHHPSATAWRGLMAAVFLLILFGFNPDSDVLVHTAGFLMGAIFGLLMRPLMDRPARQLRWDFACKVLFILLVAGPWWRALR